MGSVETSHDCASGETLPDLLAECLAPRIHENREDCIAKAAYLIAQHRGFASGHELEDWLAAENEVDERLASEGHAY